MKKCIKNLIVSFCTFVVAFSVAFMPANAQQTDTADSADFAVTFTQDGQQHTIKWHSRERLSKSRWIFTIPQNLDIPHGGDSETTRFITLPYSLQNQPVTADFAPDSTVYLDGRQLQQGQQITLAEGVHSLTVDGVSHSLTVRYTSDIPTVYIDTETGSLEDIYRDKQVKESAVFTLVEGGKTTLSTELDYIKGRGNFSWTSVPKKSFNIKFIEETSLLGIDSTQKYTLLANYIDMTLLKNQMIFSLAEAMEMEFTPKTVMTEVYINGEYMGTYSLATKPSVGANSVDITPLQELTQQVNQGTDITKADLLGTRGDNAYREHGSCKWADIRHNPYDITGGYMMELELSERYRESTCGFVSDYGQTVALAYPEYASEEQVEYISSYYNEMEQAILSDNGCNSLGKHYSQYLDVQSFAKMFLLQEYTKNLDAGLTSFYIYKDSGGLITAGALWDMDSTLGREFERFGDNIANPENLWVANSRRVGDDTENQYTILALLWRHSDFRAEVIRMWKENLRPQLESFPQQYTQQWQELKQSVYAERNRWVGAKLTQQQLEYWCDFSLEYVTDYIQRRAEYLDSAYAEGNFHISYNPNGGSGAVCDGNLYPAGSNATVKENLFELDNAQFLGWNTAADGSGSWYSPASHMEVTEDITLYAQWEITQLPQTEEGGIIAFIKSIIRRILG